jgi:hypothetical protein
MFRRKNNHSRSENLGADEIGTSLEQSILQQEQHKELERDISILYDGDGSQENRLQKEAQKEVQTAAAASLKKLHVIQMGRCPLCGEHLHQHLFASICEACGWHTFDVPEEGPVRVHLKNGGGVIEGERCYVVKTGFALVIKNDLVIAKIPRDAYDWVEYVWNEEEIDQRHRLVVDRMEIRCGWCGGKADPEKDGFHLVHVAFGATQERYCLCSDTCYESFRKMYPSRVHRDCYERNCSECNLCIKRYVGDAEGIRMLAKDFVNTARQK